MTLDTMIFTIQSKENRRYLNNTRFSLFWGSRRRCGINCNISWNGILSLFCAPNGNIGTKVLSSLKIAAMEKLTVRILVLVTFYVSKSCSIISFKTY